MSDASRSPVRDGGAAGTRPRASGAREITAGSGAAGQIVRAATDAANDAGALEIAVQTAREAGLSYVSDERPGIRRVAVRNGFRYVDPAGKPVRDKAVLDRIRMLAIPPAWANVWICTSANGHLQATGRDARGRKQYRYHAKWRSVRDENKFGRLAEFARALPGIRRRISADMRLPGLAREKVLAAVVRLLETTYIRIGNERYARENGSFGLTTMRNRHVRVRGERIAFDFRGKSGRQHHIELEDARLARVIRKCRDLPGQDLFQYVDEQGEVRSIGSSDVNDYLRAISGQDYTAKDFRTWAGTVLAALALREAEAPRSATHARKELNAAIAAVAQRLGNTVAVCRKCYIHPRVMERYLEGVDAQAAQDFVQDPAWRAATRRKQIEDAVVRLLDGRKRRARKARSSAANAPAPGKRQVERAATKRGSRQRGSKRATTRGGAGATTRSKAAGDVERSSSRETG